MFSTFGDISAYIQRHRSSGIVHVYFVHRDDDRVSAMQTADAFISRRGFKTCAGHWDPISRRDVTRVWTHILHRDLAYDTQLMPLETARELAADFLALFDRETAIYLTNCRVAELGKTGFSWHPITESTFDVGAIAMDESEIGMIWVEDED